MDPDAIDTTVAAQAKSLYRFLREYVDVRSRKVRDVKKYQDVIWLDQFPEEGGAGTVIFSGTCPHDRPEAWLWAKRPPRVPEPQPPVALVPWAYLAEEDGDRPRGPRFVERMVIEDEEVVFADDPERVEAWDVYTRKWEAWREEERGHAVVRAVYERLFALERRLEREGEQFELVIAAGLLSWRTGVNDGDEPILRHLLVCDAEIELDPTSGVITVQPPPTGATIRLEQDMLEVGQRMGDSEVQEIDNKLADVAQIADPDEVREALTQIANVLDPGSHYSEDMSHRPSSDPTPHIAFAPALILRRRGERPLIQAYDTILRILDEGEVPIGVRALLDPEAKALSSDEVDDGDRLSSLGVVMPDEHLLPLPANDEQVQIVHRLSRERGVVVQGPPGTGKSHTIANLICDLLAKGNRVLVTSETSQALQVLQDKLPKSMRDLCVSVLGSTRGTNTALQGSIQGILAQKLSHDEARSSHAIKRRNTDLAQAQEASQLVYRQLVESREAEIRTHDLGGRYQGSPSDIGAALAADQARYEWLTLDEVCASEAPVQSDEAIELLGLLRAEDVRDAERLGLGSPGVTLADLASPDAVVGWLESERQRQADLDGAREQAAARLTLAQAAAAGAQADAEALRQGVPDVVIADAAMAPTLQRLAQGLDDALSGIDLHKAPWLDEERARALVGRTGSRHRLTGEVTKLLDAVRDDVTPARGHRVTGLEDRALAPFIEQAEGLRTHLVGGGKLKNLLSTPAPVRRAEELLSRVRLDGSPADDVPTLNAAIPALRVAEAVERAWRVWGSEAPVLDDPARLFDELNTEVALYNEVDGLGKWAGELVSECRRAGYPLVLPVERGSLDALLGDLRAHEKQVGAEAVASTAEQVADDAAQSVDQEAARGESEIAQAEQAFERARAPRAELALRADALLDDGGIPELAALSAALTDGDEAAYLRSYGAIADQVQWFTRLGRRDELAHALRIAGAKPLVDLMGPDPGPEWDQRMAELSEAWQWRLADRRLAELTDLARQQRLEQEMDAHERRVSEARAELASALAWHHLFTRMQDADAQHLQAYAEAMRKLGKGTGKYAATHRANAQKHLTECQAAVPAWIMPLYQVAQTVSIEPNRFDVVIVDEASQAGIEAMHLFFLAPKIIVVGDQEQISPQGVGIDRGVVQELQRKFLKDVPHGDQLDVQSNLFAQAKIRFPGVIALREHFRCMPEIIEFSNRLCYEPLKQALIPLRQFGSDRLPPLRNIFVPHGYRTNPGKPDQFNQPEAEALMDEVARCIADPAYRGRSMGIISLLGGQQVKSLTQLLQERIHPAEIVSRRIRVGDAYAFQGDERDVMFLSMVTTMEPGMITRAVTDDETKRRFNVAASRAKDQMWLAHSVKVDDLRPDCLRRQLLSHVVAPRVKSIDGGLDPAGYDDEVLKLPFESIFEQQVYRRICSRGYSVVPQFPVGSYRIDLVVVGGAKRLAVECDGDQYHTEENLDDDLWRERQLRRAGWEFVRIRGGAYFRDKDVALEKLWAKLEELDVARAGEVAEEEAADSSPVVEEATPRLNDDADDLSQGSFEDDADDYGSLLAPLAERRVKGATGPPEAQIQHPPAETSDTPDDPSDRVGPAPAFLFLNGVVVEAWPSTDPLLADYEEIDTESATSTKKFPDPRQGSSRVIHDGLLSVVDVEGPVVIARLFSTYVKCGGRHRVTAPIHERLAEHLDRLRQVGKVTVDVDADGARVVRLVDKPSIVVRVRGPRGLAEIPLGEIAAVVADTIRRNPHFGDEQLKREVLARLELQRLTPAADERLSTAIAIATAG